MIYQQALFEYDHLASVVNVASVPQRSPFRYPGGKTWLAPRVRQWLAPSVREQLGLAPTRAGEFVEPFAGGGIIGLTVAFERLAEHVTLVEIDEDVASVWQTILTTDGAEWLAQEILGFDMSHDTVAAAVSRTPRSVMERAFQTILRNRVCHGGILAPGSGLLKNGENGKGLRSRWYPETLARRIRAIAGIRDRITFIQGDGLSVMNSLAEDPRAVFFIDPPYTVPGKGKRAGSRLYTHAHLDHEKLFHHSAKLVGDFLMTYDAAEEVLRMAQDWDFETRLIPMKNTHHAQLQELLISRRLAWVTQAPLPRADENGV